MGRKPKAAAEAATAKITESNGLSSRKETSAIIRRSGRLQKLNPPAQSLEIQPIIEIGLSEDEKAHNSDVEENPEPTDRSFDEKLDYLVQAVDELKAEANKRCSQEDIPPINRNYRNLYFDAQKKVEALTKENYELSKKVDVALGKMEAYTEATHNWSEMLRKVKDVIMVSNLSKATETALFEGISSPKEIDEPNGAVEPQGAAKRKKRAKGAETTQAFI